jgi:MFS family permease
MQGLERETTHQAAGSKPIRRKRVRQVIGGLVLIAVVIPFQFYLRFGEVPAMGWGFTVFLVLLSALVEIGLAYAGRVENHTRVAVRGGWADRLGAFWLVACAFTPLLGWFLTSALTITIGNWQLLYGLRAVLCIGLPLITALPLARYLDRSSARVAAPILIGITLIAMLAGWWVLRDLIDGPRPGMLEITSAGSCLLVEPVRQEVPCQPEWGLAPKTLPVSYLAHTRRSMLMDE